MLIALDGGDPSKNTHDPRRRAFARIIADVFTVGITALAYIDNNPTTDPLYVLCFSAPVIQVYGRSLALSMIDGLMGEASKQGYHERWDRIFRTFGKTPSAKEVIMPILISVQSGTGETYDVGSYIVNAMLSHAFRSTLVAVGGACLRATTTEYVNLLLHILEELLGYFKSLRPTTISWISRALIALLNLAILPWFWMKHTLPEARQHMFSWSGVQSALAGGSDLDILDRVEGALFNLAKNVQRPLTESTTTIIYPLLERIIRAAGYLAASDARFAVFAKPVALFARLTTTSVADYLFPMATTFGSPVPAFAPAFNDVVYNASSTIDYTDEGKYTWVLRKGDDWPLGFGKGLPTYRLLKNAVDKLANMFQYLPSKSSDAGGSEYPLRAKEWALRVLSAADNATLFKIVEWASLKNDASTSVKLAMKFNVDAIDGTASKIIEEVLDPMAVESISRGVDTVWKGVWNITQVTEAVPGLVNGSEDKNMMFMLALRIASAIPLVAENAPLVNMDASSKGQADLFLTGLREMKDAALAVKSYLDTDSGTFIGLVSNAATATKNKAFLVASAMSPSASTLVWAATQVASFQTYTPTFLQNFAASAATSGLWALVSPWGKKSTGTGEHEDKKTDAVREPPIYPSFANVDLFAPREKDAPVIHPAETPEPAGKKATQDAVAAAIGILFDTLSIPAELTDARIAEIRRTGVDMGLLVQMNAALRDMQTGKPSVLPPPMVDRAIIAYVLEPADLTNAIAVMFGVRSENVVEAMGIAIDFLLLYGIFLSTPVLKL
jgi:hypothetical protein